VHEETHIDRRAKHRRLRENHETKAMTTRLSRGWNKRNDKGRKKWSNLIE
jgi:transcription initiation factor TFIID subunit TAF12